MIIISPNIISPFSKMEISRPEFPPAPMPELVTNWDMTSWNKGVLQDFTLTNITAAQNTLGVASLTDTGSGGGFIRQDIPAMRAGTSYDYEIKIDAIGFGTTAFFGTNRTTFVTWFSTGIKTGTFIADATNIVFGIINKNGTCDLDYLSIKQTP